MKVNVMLVCLGNICRSPTAHGVFEQMVRDAGLTQHIQVESSGTGDWHIGEAPDQRATEAAAQRGYDLRHLVARQLKGRDFEHFHYILAMDQENLVNIKALRPANFKGEIRLFLDYAKNSKDREVPDPYYGGGRGFDKVLDLVEDASRGLLEHIRQQHDL